MFPLFHSSWGIPENSSDGPGHHVKSRPDDREA